MAQIWPGAKKREQSLHQQMTAIDFWEHDMLGYVRDYIETVESYLAIQQINKERSYDIHQFEALDDMMLIRSHKSKIADYQNDHSQVFNELNLCHFLVKHSHKPLSFFT